MSQGLKREFCLWMVGGKDGRVRKIRFTLRALLATVGTAAIVGGGFVFVASDYARVQLQKAESYFRLRRVLEEKRELEGTAQSLQSTVSTLTSAQRKALNYEQQIRARLDELASLLNTSDPGRMLAPALGGSRVKNQKGNTAPIHMGGFQMEEDASSEPHASSLATHKDTATRTATISSGEEVADGVGGAEIYCGNASADEEGGSCGESARASLKPMAFSIEETDVALEEQEVSLFEYSPRGDLLHLLDSHIETLRLAPIGLPAPGYISSPYGYRVSPFHGGPSMHEGIDFSLPAGSTIHATGDGTVLRVTRNRTYGLVVDIAHSSRIVSRYAHMSKVLVSEGEHICRGEVLGLVGSTGRSTAPHLHYEVLIDRRAVNPLPFMRLALDLKEFLRRMRVAPSAA